MDIGKYNKDKKVYQSLVNELYSKYPGGIILPSEYAQFVQEDLLRFLIRLSRYKFVARQLRNTDHVLEIGSGSGLGSIFLGQHCAKVIGLDVKTSEVEEAIAINKRENIDFIVGDIFDMEVTQKFDVIVALDVIEHMPVEQGRKLVAIMVRHLKETGMVVIGTPSIYSYEYQGALSKASHVKCYDQQELIELMDKYFHRVLSFSMNDELVHTGHPKMAWYYFMLGFYPKTDI